ncbi:NAD(P)H-dependent oxidoreductase subunit E [Limnochorda pilosa]|uniref:NADH dehydrogenase subunit F n=1 Tax=Limnochorda pilosa TaxID=1555112 RepID=A0A0K2SH58_LIMPI|nr:NAD(P)H-dependent oxidoreductase subunit E [Limnochorda pilosa]BAS26456.1 NADH dehydrogenase subunit F [Limnochorda pilosa]
MSPLAPMPGRGLEPGPLEKAPDPEPQELAALEGVWGALAPQERRGRRDLLLPALRALQASRGWISYSALAAVCRELTMPLAEAYGVASFYELLATEPRPRRMIHLCDDVACTLKGAGMLAGRLQALLGHPEQGEGPLGWSLSPCLGQCERGPAALVGDRVWVGLTPEGLEDAVGAWMAGEEARAHAGGVGTHLGSLGEGTPLLLRRCGRVDPGSLEAYVEHGGYRGLRRALQLGPEATLAEVEASGLVGRGGAAFPTARKWASAAREPAPRYVVCNADESEPGSFKDRVLMEQDPFAVLEGLTLAALAVGAERGFIYVRGEYPESHRSLLRAAEQARAAGFLGERILESGFSFDVELRQGAGAYVCGEETALFNSIEGLRGEPRARPPYPAQVGLFGRPTVINNVETLAAVPAILERGGGWYASLGSGRSRGTKLLSVSGHVVRAGVYEVAFGTPLRTILEDLAGGVPGGGAVQAVLCGGAAGTFLGPDQLDTPLSLEALQAVGGTVGSGSLVVLDETVDLWAVVERIARFFRDESCGQCVPCRVGTQRQLEVVSAVRRAGGPVDDQALAMLNDLAQVMRDASICGLGQLAPNAVQSSLRLLGRSGGDERG